jgi:hypothetical protein
MEFNPGRGFRQAREKPLFFEQNTVIPEPRQPLIKEATDKPRENKHTKKDKK